MGLEVWFKDDVCHVLVSLGASTHRFSQWNVGSQAVAYHQGFQDALLAAALAFGLDAADVMASCAFPVASPGCTSPPSDGMRREDMSSNKNQGILARSGTT